MSAWNKAGSFAKPASAQRDPPTTTQHGHSASLSRIRQMNREKSFSSVTAGGPLPPLTPGSIASPLQSPALEQSGFGGLSNSIVSLSGDRATTSSSSAAGIHPLRAPWCLWYMHRAPGTKIKDYDVALKRIGAFSSVEDFWCLYVRLKPLTALPTVSDVHLFRAGIKPTYEDPANTMGGKWQVRLKKGIAPRIWEQLVLAILGDQFHSIGAESGAAAEEELCGAVMSVRQHEDVLSVWNRTRGGGPATLKIRTVLRQVLGFGPEVVFEYVAHQDRLGK